MFKLDEAESLISSNALCAPGYLAWEVPANSAVSISYLPIGTSGFSDVFQQLDSDHQACMQWDFTRGPISLAHHR